MTEQPPSDNGDLYWIDSADFLSATNETPDGWRLPVKGTLVSYIYINPLEFAFEVWLGGSADVTVCLGRPFTYDGGGRQAMYDPRTSRKADLGGLLDIGTERVTDFLISRSGTLEILFSGRHHLTAGPAEDGEAWRLEWPMDGGVQVAARAGGGLNLEPRSSIAPRRRAGAPIDAYSSLEPVVRDEVVELPINGLVKQLPVNRISIEMMIPIPSLDSYCVHFGGAMEIVDGPVRSGVAAVTPTLDRHWLDT